MEKGRKQKLIILVVLVGILSISIGFAAFTKVFNTNIFNATVAQGENAFANGLILESSYGTVSGGTWSNLSVDLSDTNRNITITGADSNTSKGIIASFRRKHN